MYSSDPRDTFHIDDSGMSDDSEPVDTTIGTDTVPIDDSDTNDTDTTDTGDTTGPNDTDTWVSLTTCYQGSYVIESPADISALASFDCINGDLDIEFDDDNIDITNIPCRAGERNVGGLLVHRLPGREPGA